MRAIGKTREETVTLNKPIVVATSKKTVKLNELLIRVFYDDGAYQVVVRPQERTATNVTEVITNNLETRHRGVSLLLERDDKYSSKKLNDYAESVGDIKRHIRMFYEAGDMISLTRTLLAISNLSNKKRK